MIVGLYEDGTPGELFITMAKEGSTIGGLMDSLGTAISLALQYGVPVESIVNKFAHQRFEPMGMTTNSDIPFAKSLVDYIFRWLGMQFINGYREQNAPRRTKPAELSGGGMNAHGIAGSAPISNAEAKEAAWPSRSGITTHDGSTSGSSTQASASHSVQAKADAQEILSRRSISVVVAESIVDGSDGADQLSRKSVKETVKVGETRDTGNALDQSNAHLMGDAPACDGCGSITVRNGTCYRCLNCGSSMGCS